MRRVLRPARPQRGRQDDDHGDPRGLPITRVRSRAGARHRPRARRPRVEVATRHRPAVRPGSRGPDRGRGGAPLRRLLPRSAGPRRGHRRRRPDREAGLPEREALGRPASAPRRGAGHHRPTPSCCSSTSPRPASIPRRAGTSGTLIEGLKDEGTTILLTTHYLEEAEHLADRVAVISRGRVLACDPPASLGGRQHGGALVSWLEDGQVVVERRRWSRRGQSSTSPPGSTARSPGSRSSARGSRTSTSRCSTATTTPSRARAHERHRIRSGSRAPWPSAADGSSSSCASSSATATPPSSTSRSRWCCSSSSARCSAARTSPPESPSPSTSSPG